jgi:hypothetical protein
VSRTECSSVKQGREASTSREKFATRVGCGSIVGVVLIFPKICTLLIDDDIPRVAKTVPLTILCIACSVLCAYLWRSRQKRRGGMSPDRNDGADDEGKDEEDPK